MKYQYGGIGLRVRTVVATHGPAGEAFPASTQIGLRGRF
jgi:hypothetical protein